MVRSFLFLFLLFGLRLDRRQNFFDGRGPAQQEQGAAVRRAAWAGSGSPMLLDGFGRTPLHLAAARASDDASLSELSTMAKQMPEALHIRNRAGLTPLLCARNGRALAILAQHGGDATSSGNSGETPLHLAAASDDDVPDRVGLAAAALRAGTLITAADCTGQNAMHIAASRADTELLAVLLKAKGAVDALRARCRQGLTPAQYLLLRWCSPCLRMECMGDSSVAPANALRMLLSHGDPSAGMPLNDPATQAAVDAAQRTNCETALQVLHSFRLLRHGRGSDEAVAAATTSRGSRMLPDETQPEEAENEYKHPRHCDEPRSRQYVQSLFTQPCNYGDGWRLTRSLRQAMERLSALVADVPAANPRWVPAASTGRLFSPLLSPAWLAWLAEPTRARLIARGSASLQPMARAISPPVAPEACFNPQCVRQVTSTDDLRQLLIQRDSATETLNIVGLPQSALGPLGNAALAGRDLFDVDVYVASHGGAPWQPPLARNGVSVTSVRQLRRVCDCTCRLAPRSVPHSVCWRSTTLFLPHAGRRIVWLAL